MKLWQKDFAPDKAVEHFTVDDDYLLDQQLLFWDCVASSAHAAMLFKIKLLKEEEYTALKKCLKEITELQKSGNFSITQENEDCHTAIEMYLVKILGDVGKKIHTARSRNDQVLVATRLSTKAELQKMSMLILKCIKILFTLAEKHQDVPMPGYTHMQKAMPSSVGLFFGSYIEALLDDLLVLKNAYELNNQNPLGSAAGYGTHFSIDREYTTKLLGFDKIQNNVLYCQNSRGKIEGTVVHALLQTMQDCAKLATDILLFSMPQFSYFSFPKEVTTGSSIMPQKKNLDVLELIRAKASVVQGNFVIITTIAQKLPSGYNRDYQLLKKYLIQSFETTEAVLQILSLVLEKIEVQKENCIKDCTPEIFATDAANALVEKGMPFRDAYKKVSGELSLLQQQDPVKNILEKKHIGASGNLGLEKSRKLIKEYSQWIMNEEEELNNKIHILLG